MTHHRSADTPTWPFVAVVGCLFLLSVLAAESWQARPSGHPRSALEDRRAARPKAGAWPQRTALHRHAHPKKVARATLPQSQTPTQMAATTLQQPGRAAAPPLEPATTGAGPVPTRAVKPEPVRSILVRGKEIASGDSPTATIRPTAEREPAIPLDRAHPAPSAAGAPSRAQQEEPQQEEPGDESVRLGRTASTMSEIAAPQQTTDPPDQAGPAAAADPAVPLPEVRESGQGAESIVQQFETPSQVSTIAPPVAERIDLDLSVGKTPSLPDPVPADEAPRHPSAESFVPLIEDPVPPNSQTTEVAATPSAWPTSPSLISILESLGSVSLASDWAEDALRTLHRMERYRELSAEAVSETLDELKQLTERAAELAADAETDDGRAQILRAVYALQRREEVWSQIHNITRGPADGLVPVHVEDLKPILDEVEQTLSSNTDGPGWYAYLRLDELRGMNSSTDSTARARLARSILLRIESEERLDERQRNYLQRSPFAELEKSLRKWAREPIDYWQLVHELEGYELHGDAGLAANVAEVYQRARWSDDPSIAELAETLNAHYRNANLRVATSSQLVNRLLPQPGIVEEDVNESILGAQVTGTSRTSSQISVVLVPDPQLWRIDLEAVGEVSSTTAANKGPATFYNEGHSRFEASKLLLVDRLGVKVESAEAEAQSHTELRGFETNLDTVPIVGLLARSIARQQHNGRITDARAETEARLEERARERLDDEVQQRLAELETNFRDNILEPLKRLELQPAAVDMQTTSDRLVIRYRLAGANQLGAHTPRPQAPGDSLLSVQIHETALNNTVDQLQLRGRRTDLRSLYQELADQFERSDLVVPDDIPRNVTIQFAERDAVRLHFEDGRVALTMRIAELQSRRNRWRNFAVRVYYVPDSSQLQANLVREGVVELAGRRLGWRDQIALRGIFSKVFAKNRPVNIINKRLARHPRMHDLQVTQFVISDGWIGVALGPQRAGALRHLATDPSNQAR